MTNEKIYMLVACFVKSIRNNLEIVDYNLTYSEAKMLMANYKKQSRKETGSDWELDLMTDGEIAIKIVEQKERM